MLSEGSPASGQCQEVSEPAVYFVHGRGIYETELADEVVPGHGSRLFGHRESRSGQAQVLAPQPDVVGPSSVLSGGRQQ